MKMSEKTKEILEWFYCIIIALALAILIRYFVGTPTVVKQESMFPTLKQDQRLILNRVGRTMHKMPERGDIITFEEPSKVNVSEEEVNLDNPVAYYENEPTGLFHKFSYYVLEIGKRSYIKRVIALPGEQVEIKQGNVYINGKQLEEPYLQENVITEANGPYDSFIVPENCVFAMGDNRSRSTDCRAFGCIPLEKIESTVLFRFWPLDVFGKID